jgi:hypothetical protein
MDYEWREVRTNRAANPHLHRLLETWFLERFHPESGWVEVQVDLFQVGIAWEGEVLPMFRRIRKELE